MPKCKESGVHLVDEIKILHGDCLELLKTIPDNSVDLVITDPPYQFETQGGGAFGKAKVFGETAPIADGFDLQVLDECLRVLKKTNIYIWCSRAQLPMYFEYFVKDRLCNFNILTWHKRNIMPACGNKYISDTEYCLFFREKGVKVYGTADTKKTYYVTTTNKADKDKWQHPTIKPEFIIENLVINSSIRGGVVLDPFMGSGTTGVACKKLGRNFIGMELEQQWYDIAQKRIEQTGQNVPEIAEQLQLF